jgi:hypothetical protein
MGFFIFIAFIIAITRLTGLTDVSWWVPVSLLIVEAVVDVVVAVAMFVVAYKG